MKNLFLEKAFLNFAILVYLISSCQYTLHQSHGMGPILKNLTHKAWY